MIGKAISHYKILERVQKEVWGSSPKQRIRRLCEGYYVYTLYNNRINTDAASVR